MSAEVTIEVEMVRGGEPVIVFRASSLDALPKPLVGGTWPWSPAQGWPGMFAGPPVSVGQLVRFEDDAGVWAWARVEPTVMRRIRPPANLG